MKTFNQWLSKVTNQPSLRQLMYVVLVLLIVLLLNLTWPFWNGTYQTLKIIFKPFIYGFVLAYLSRPAVLFFERHGIKRMISVPLMLVAFILGFSVLFASFLPKLLSDLSQLSLNFGAGIESIYEMYISKLEAVPSPVIENVVDQLVQITNDLFKNLSTLPVIVGDSINTVISWFTTGLFSLVIGIYIVMDYEKLTTALFDMIGSNRMKLRNAIIVVNEATKTYLSSLLVIMLITFVEYAIFYFLVGHKYALVLGILSAFSRLIPYVGGIAMNVLGFISGLGLGGTRIAFILLGLLILPNVDSYFLAPFVYKKRNQTNPLLSLFSLFACATLFGFVGVLISMPLYLSIRAVLLLRKHNWTLEECENGV